MAAKGTLWWAGMEGPICACAGGGKALTKACGTHGGLQAGHCGPLLYAVCSRCQGEAQQSKLPDRSERGGPHSRWHVGGLFAVPLSHGLSWGWGWGVWCLSWAAGRAKWMDHVPPDAMVGFGQETSCRVGWVVAGGTWSPGLGV